MDLREVENRLVGTFVTSENPATNKYEPAKVLGVFQRPNGDLRVMVERESGSFELQYLEQDFFVSRDACAALCRSDNGEDEPESAAAA